MDAAGYKKAIERGLEAGIRQARANAVVGHFDGELSGPTPEKQIPFGSAQGRLSRRKKAARNDKIRLSQYRKCRSLTLLP